MSLPAWRVIGWSAHSDLDRPSYFEALLGGDLVSKNLTSGTYIFDCPCQSLVIPLASHPTAPLNKYLLLYIPVSLDIGTGKWIKAITVGHEKVSSLLYQIGLYHEIACAFHTDYKV